VCRQLYGQIFKTDPKSVNPIIRVNAMKNRLIPVILIVCVLLSFTVQTQAVSQGETLNVAQQMSQFNQIVYTKANDVSSLLDATFIQNPRLFYYFSGGEYRTTENGREIEIEYINQDYKGKIWIIRSEDELRGVLGLALANLETQVALVVTDNTITGDAICKATDWVREKYYLAYMGCSCCSYTSMHDASTGMTAYTVDFTYAEDTQTIQKWRNETEQAVMDISSNLFAQDMPNWKKELLIHDYLVENCRYSTSVHRNPVDYTAYGALINGSAVCEGYARAAQLLLDAAGIQNITASGVAGGVNHIWNVVCLDGKWYNLDITWDDPITSNGSDLMTHEYFNVTDEQLSADHEWTSTVHCTSTDFGYSAVFLMQNSDSRIYKDYTNQKVMTQGDIESLFESRIDWSDNETDNILTDKLAADGQAQVDGGIDQFISGTAPGATLVSNIFGTAAALFLCFLPRRLKKTDHAE
jgi:hypothetical protein